MCFFLRGVKSSKYVTLGVGRTHLNNLEMLVNECVSRDILLGTLCFGYHFCWGVSTVRHHADTVDGRNPANHLGCIKPCK